MEFRTARIPRGIPKGSVIRASGFRFLGRFRFCVKKKGAVDGGKEGGRERGERGRGRGREGEREGERERDKSIAPTKRHAGVAKVALFAAESRTEYGLHRERVR